MTRKEQASTVNADLLEVNTWSQQESTVTTLTAFPTTDARGLKAVAIAADAGQWILIRTHDGRKYYGIRSSANRDEVYFVNRTSCTCYDSQSRTCKHMLAVQMHCERLAAEQATEPDEDVFARFEQDDRPLPTPDLSRILGRPRRGVIPAAQIERED